MNNEFPSKPLEIKSIDITFGTIDTKWSRMTPHSIRNKVEEIYRLTQNNPKHAIAEILQVNKKYKNIPVLNNFLCSCYIAINDLENAKKVARNNYKLFPKYLFARTSYAQVCLKTNELDKIPDFFDQKHDLKSLYPERKVFHISEFLSFMGIWTVYLYKTGEKKLAKRYYKIMKEADSSHPLTKSIKRQIHPPLLLRILEKWVGPEKLEEMRKEALKK